MKVVVRSSSLWFTLLSIIVKAPIRRAEHPGVRTDSPTNPETARRVTAKPHGLTILALGRERHNDPA